MCPTMKLYAPEHLLELSYKGSPRVRSSHLSPSYIGVPTLDFAEAMGSDNLVKGERSLESGGADLTDHFSRTDT